jgi:hypothetical protein
MWLKELRKHHESLCPRKAKATRVIQLTSLYHKNVKYISENLKEVISRHSFTANKTCTMYRTGNSTVYVPKLCVLME